MESLKVDDVMQITLVVSKILVNGLGSEQREKVLSEAPGGLKDVAAHDADETRVYQAILNEYLRSHDFDFVVEIYRRIEATKVFYRNVGSDLDLLKYLIKSTGVGERMAARHKPYVFVLMPFRDEFFQTYESAIRPALQDLGCEVQNAKEVLTVDRIVDAIFDSTARARFLVADTTGQNANVFYEIGYAHGIGKKVILLSQNRKDLPFDTASIRHIKYSRTAPYSLRDELRMTAEAVMEELGEDDES